MLARNRAAIRTRAALLMVSCMEPPLEAVSAPLAGKKKRGHRGSPFSQTPVRHQPRGLWGWVSRPILSRAHFDIRRWRIQVRQRPPQHCLCCAALVYRARQLLDTSLQRRIRKARIDASHPYPSFRRFFHPSLLQRLNNIATAHLHELLGIPTRENTRWPPPMRPPGCCMRAMRPRAGRMQAGGHSGGGRWAPPPRARAASSRAQRHRAGRTGRYRAA